jgi:hypothetical protein
MNEDALRALVRESIARQLGQGMPMNPAAPAVPLSFIGHPSQYRYDLPQSDGPCIIEPGVQCNHCGYCQSHGH